MVRVRGFVGACLAAAALAATGAEGTGTVIAGMVHQDRLALGVRSHFLAAEGVAVKLFRDDGDGMPSAPDALLATTITDRAGVYVFSTPGPGAYWVVVDSRSFERGAWPEQTYGPAGSLCAHPEQGTRVSIYEGTCFGGRTIAGSDDASSITTAEHLALLSVRESVTNADFAFSYDAVTHTRDGEGIQGSLRQFVRNANALHGVNRMRFVPVERSREHRSSTMGVPPRWWTISLSAPLPALEDENTFIDGSAFNPIVPSITMEVNPGRFGEPPTLTSGEPDVSRLQRPELELVFAGGEGIVCAATCGLRAFALHGANIGIVTRANARAEHILVGTTPDGDAAAGGEVGLQVERGTFNGRHVLVAAQSRIGISVAPGATLHGELLDVSRSGNPGSGAGIALFSHGSEIRGSIVSANPGAGILLGSTDGTAPATGSIIESTIISGNQAGVVIGPGSAGNAITRNNIMWNRVGGVTVAPFLAIPPRANRISANRFNENGLRPIILNLEATHPNQLSAGSDGCASSASAANEGIAAPRVTSVRVANEGGLRAQIRGRACPGQLVELYQSFVTSEIHESRAELRDVRDARTQRETLNVEGRSTSLPSIGEFNYLGVTTTRPDGTFEGNFPLPSAQQGNDASTSTEPVEIWAEEVLAAADPDDRAFSAIAIDAAGNTSEMGVRRKTD